MKAIRFNWAEFLILVLVVVAAYTYVLLTPDDAQPPDLTDLQVERPSIPGVPDEESMFISDQNAYVHLLAAVEAMDFPTELRERLKTDAADSTLVQEIVDRNDHTYDLIVQAAHSQFLFTGTVNSFHDKDPLAGICKELKPLLKCEIQTFSQDDDFVTAFLTLLRLGNLCHTYPDCITQWLIGMDFQCGAMQNFRDLAAHSGVSNPSMIGFCRELSTQDAINESFQYAVKNDCLQTLALIETTDFATENGTYWLDSVLRRLIYQPNTTKKKVIDCYRDALKSSELSWSELPLSHVRSISKSNAVEAGKTLTTGNAVGKFMFTDLCRNLERVIISKYRLEAETVITRVFVACQLYIQQHGELPESLDALVPDFLGEAPIDPFDGFPLRYDRERAIVYSVGYDAVDSAGSTKPCDPAKTAPVGPWLAEDAVYSLL